MKAVLIPGDGIGKEISQSVVDITKAMNLDIEWVEYQAGAEYAAKTKEVFEPGLVDAIKEYKWALKGPTATPIGTGFRSVNVALRQKFATYANVRPIRSFKGIDSKYENIDLVMIRENTEDLYKGIEYMVGDDVAHGIKLITREASEKICRYAFEYAKANNEIKKILWAPRWTYDEKIGKSHFFEYKDKFNELSKTYPNILFTIRPHPMMFSNFIKSGLMTEEEFLHYKKELELLGIELSLNKDVSEDLKTTDILISDFSSIIPMFYFMNKPVIYTDADMALNEEYCIIMDNSYIADNWNKVREYIDDLVNGIDLKNSQRYADIKEQYKLHHEASRKIVDCLVNDYIKNEMEA